VGVTLGATLVFVSLVWLGRSLFTKYNEIYYYKQHRLELSRELLIDQSAADGLLNNTNGFGTNALDWTIRYDLLTIGETIGTGSAGTVHKGKYLGENVAIKRISQGNKWDRESFFENFRRETSILSHLHHPNIVRFYGVSFLPSSSNSSDGGSFFIVTELCSHSLGHVLAANSYSRNEKLNIAIQIAHGIQALHSKKIIHRDLKPDNVLIDKNGNAKLADFGVAKQSQMSKKNPRSSKVAATVAVGTPIYMAPELALSTVAPTPKADIFSYGIMLNAIFAGEEPYAAETSGMNPFMLMGRIGQGKRPDLAPDLDNEIVDLLQLCWSENPNDRPSVAQVLKVLKRLV
jgi:serine/threonine protein kinase